MELGVEDYLNSKGLILKRAGTNEVHVSCFFCGEDESKRGRLYINVDPLMEPQGLFHCKLCDERGGYNKIRKWYGDSIIRSDGQGGGSVQMPSAEPISMKIIRAAADYYYEKLADNEDAFKYLKYERGLNFETIEKHQLGWADGTLRPHLESLGFQLGDMVRSGLVNENGRDFLYSHITIPYFVSGNAVSIRGKEIGGKYLTPPGHKAKLYNSDATWGSPEKVIICEGEFDALVIEQMGIAAVGVPGAGTWQDSWTSYLDNAKRIYICFDTDTAGRTGSEKLSTKLGGRAKIINLPDDEDGNDISDWVVKNNHTKEEFQMLLIKARGGILITVDEAYEEWCDIEGNPNLVGIKFGYDLIDKQIFPGLLPAQVVIVLAKTGAGKTIWLLNTFQRIAMEQPEKKILFVSLEQTRNEWFERARRIDRFYNLDADEKHTLDFWRHKLLMVDKNRVTEEELVNCIEQYEYDMGAKPDVVAVDYLGYWAKSYGSNPYESTSSAIMAMKAVAKEMRVPFIAPHQVSRIAAPGEEPDLSSARDSGVVEETADFMFALWAPDQRQARVQDERSGEVNLKVLKSRHGGVGTKVEMQFDPTSLVMIPKGDPLHSRAVDGHGFYRRGDTFDQAIERHRTGIRTIVGGDYE